MRIGPLQFGERPLVLAPMEDVSDPPFRILCRRFGADLVVTEFVSSGGLIHGAQDSAQKLDIDPGERPTAIQIFGGDPEQMEKAARIVDQAEPDLVDINFGCPVKKVIGQGAGAAALRDLDLMERLADAVVRNVSSPVTVKTRLGWSDGEIRIHEAIYRLQDVGVQAVTVHARTRTQQYRGKADWSQLKRLKEDHRIRIPIIGNGDVFTPQDVCRMFSDTGVDAVMIGRGAVGYPWIFREAKALLAGRALPAPPDLDERLDVIREHLLRKCTWLGERRGVLEMRRMYGGYLKGVPRSSQLRRRLMTEETLRGVLALLEEWRGSLHRPPSLNGAGAVDEGCERSAGQSDPGSGLRFSIESHETSVDSHVVSHKVG